MKLVGIIIQAYCYKRAEGNHLEPDAKFAHQWLQAVKNVKQKLGQL